MINIWKRKVALARKQAEEANLAAERLCDLYDETTSILTCSDELLGSLASNSLFVNFFLSLPHTHNTKALRQKLVQILDDKLGELGRHTKVDINTSLELLKLLTNIATLLGTSQIVGETTVNFWGRLRQKVDRWLCWEMQ